MTAESSPTFTKSTQAAIEAAAQAIHQADALLIGAGAGMGVDSGLPDFRGPEGFWKAYPPFRGRQFHEMSTPHWFRSDPGLAWGFFGHRLNLYRQAQPHAGFNVLLQWLKRPGKAGFVFTSNVDGQFQKAGFDPNAIFECHGSIHYLQCTRLNRRLCEQSIWSAEDVQVEVDATTIRATSALPECPTCGAIARPNILMFNDAHWDPERTSQQEDRYSQWLERGSDRSIVAIEIGAGLAIPTVRWECEGRSHVLVRINPREAETPQHGISIPLGALTALTSIDQCLNAST